MAGNTSYNPDPRAHPGLAAIALLEAGKAVLAFLAAAGLEISGPAPLRSIVNTLVLRIGGDPERGSFSSLLNLITPDTVHLSAIALLAYGLLRALEAWGLWRAKAWASWLGCIGTALYLPLDLLGIYYHRSVYAWVVLGLNLVVFAVLARDLARRRKQAVIARTTDAG